ncbi:SusD/RagB family nutrient-binding outer membrane lipoprotein [Foetidibacter luteolus]|uniref:SusD/RagB family nutrient-binding outer membrane lipoprotein n=1 Tax=Foetidibacter luteolus TaxID=2608880 RepID=UPI00129B5045|nr:SusD/RagB family nutrient-binding outer membrane lipoprotein [Foetidibacter luteolus]
MKRLHKIIIALFAFAGLNSCTKDFEEINTNPVQATSLDPVYLFANAQFSAAIATYNYQLEIVQQINTPYTGVLEGGNHNVNYDPSTNAAYNTLYTTSIKFLTDVLDKTKDNAARANLYQMARIWKAHVFMVLVDTYGDVPYFNAGKAYLEQSYQPVYDDQEAIYNDILTELEDATNKLDAAQPIETSDLFYKGGIAQWKKLGNSLLLRAGMRYSKVDAAKAEATVKKAVDASRGGVFTSNADNAIIAFNATFNSPTGSWFQATERGNIYLGKPFVTHLQNMNDPRLKVISVKYADPAKPLAEAGAADTDPANQEGMPYGYNESTIATAPGFPGKIGAAFAYSQVNRRTVGKIDAPEFFVTYAQTQLLMAEAAQRGWITGNAADYYAAGVRGAMKQMAQFDVSAAISQADEDAYLAAHPYNATTGLQQINDEYWVNSFLNGSEGWANFRRSGFPALTPNPYPGADPAVKGGFIRRLTYPVREQSVNSENYAAAVARMGPDNLATRVFWDKE